jgi:hypothetical protein
MSAPVIILGIIIIILVYILYYYFTNAATKLNSQANFNTSVPGITVTNPQATRYAYSIWIYVNSWTAGVNHTIFSRDGNMKLYLDQNAPILYLDMIMNNNKINTMSITDNFPLQKWVHIIISVDNQFVDAYLNGKLIQSMRFFTTVKTNNVNTSIMPAIPPSADKLIFVGNSAVTPFTAWDAYSTLFKHWSSGPVDPQTAWTTYLSGNGKSILSSLGNYGANIQILKNNVQSSSLVLF